jgi:hypothetical protein
MASNRTFTLFVADTPEEVLSLAAAHPEDDSRFARCVARQHGGKN